MPAMRIVSLFIVGMALSACASFSQFQEEPVATPVHIEYWWSMDGWDLTQVDTARAASYLSQSEKDFILALNLARTDPRRSGHDVVEPLLDYFHGTLMRIPGEPLVQTNEGIKVVREWRR